MTKMLIEGENLKLLASMPIGMRVNSFRNKLGELEGKVITIAELAREIEVTPQTLSSVERGVIVSPSYKAIYNLSKFFNVPLEVFDDDYYIGNPKPFYLGKSENTTEVQENVDLEDLQYEEKYKLGAIYYQVFEGNTMRFIEHFISKSWIDDASMIQLLARSNFEFKLLNTVSESKTPLFIKETIGSYNDVYKRYVELNYKNSQLFSEDFKDLLITNLEKNRI
ncbi:hypothetical protein AUO94_00415 [Planococcus kocurii]|uniref:HTH cro/C1-type domain-containing protein n=1 Tax=Planococcus kocurii TaxID=1374 RepID=A0ABM5WSB0_9BACL|nr:helix-turn-helix transcriptional regulator [Planococcus kocurii]ALS77197.1 hypothetical protein AUO94_00415 [Planococcus kocurii]